MARDLAREDSNKALVRTSFERWKSGIGGPFELLAPDAEWTIVGSSPLAKTYHSKKEFIDAVIKPFNARMSSPLVPAVRGIFADGDTVIRGRCRLVRVRYPSASIFRQTIKPVEALAFAHVGH
jgi:uncharacterized protein